MGIPFYYGFLINKYPEILVSSIPGEAICSQFFLDYNALIHPAVHSVEKESLTSDSTTKGVAQSDFINACILETRVLMNAFPAQETWIMMDGVAPASKAKQQRERRFRSLCFKSPLAFDTNAISPSTPFMVELAQHVRQTFPQAHVSDTLEPGEGEHKMFRHAKSHGTIVISSADADLIILSLLHIHDHPDVNVFLVRKDNEGMTTLVDIKALATRLTEGLRGVSLPRRASSEVSLPRRASSEVSLPRKASPEVSILDYIIATFFLGNDHLPHPAMLSIQSNGVNMVMEALTEPLQYDKHIDPRALFAFVSRLFKMELPYLSQHTFETCFVDTDTLPENTVVVSQDVIRYYEKGFAARYYHYYDIQDPRHAAKEYMKGVFWTWDYYLARHTDWEWYYPYRAAPLFKDIEFTKTPIFPKNEPLHPAIQLFHILPMESGKRLIQEKWLLDLYTLKYIQTFFPTTLVLDALHKRHFWEASPLIPILNLKKIFPKGYI